MGIIDAYYSLAARVNKARGRNDNDDNVEGVVSDFLPEITIDIPDDELIDTTQKWERAWNESEAKANWQKMAEENENYWKGQQYTKLESNLLRPFVDNIIFEGTETFLPAATRQNPEPLVELRSTEEKTEAAQAYADLMRHRLADWADDVRLRLKIKKAGRHWFLFLVGVAKLGWDLTTNMPSIKIVRAHKLILDKNGITDEDGYQGKYLGHYRQLPASALVEILKKKPDCVTYIKEIAKGDLGTEIQFIEWWTNEYMCWTLGKKVLVKVKNPHFNYGTEESGTQEAGDYQAAAKGLNHLPAPKMPFVFLTVFNLGKTPVDETSLVTQVLPQQDTVNTRNKQLNKNINTMNGGVVVSEEKSGLTKDTAKGVTDAIAKGGTVVIPAGDAREAVFRMPGVGLPGDVFMNMQDNRNRFREILGITGLTPAGIKNEDTVRGKIITRGLDADRIGGGITEYLEQFSDGVFNYALQLMYVYDDVLSANQSAKVPLLKVSIKEGSMLPKDATTKANQAIELAGSGRMALIDLYKALEYADPETMAANVWLEANAPEVLFKDDPRVMQVIEMRRQAAAGAQEKPVSESINFKDLPPEGQAQMAKKVGIDIAPEQIVANALGKEAIKDIAQPEKPQPKVNLNQS